ncbi:hypothetical protein H0H92_008081, partial [Tricholoma furcatifolium]
MLTHANPSRSQSTFSPSTPSSSPPCSIFVDRIIKSSDEQASIFLQQKLKVADAEQRSKIVDAICRRSFEMMAPRFGNWAVQRCLEGGAGAGAAQRTRGTIAASGIEERRKVVACMMFDDAFSLDHLLISSHRQEPRRRARDKLLRMPRPPKGARLRGGYTPLHRVRAQE